MHPDVDFKDRHTKIKDNQEVVIGFELSPITQLVSEEWRLALENVCIERLFEQQGHCSVEPGKGEGHVSR